MQTDETREQSNTAHDIIAVRSEKEVEEEEKRKTIISTYIHIHVCNNELYFMKSKRKGTKRIVCGF